MHAASRTFRLIFALVAASVVAARLDALPWIETAQLAHAGASANDEFGFSVALDGNVAVVGRPNGALAAVFVDSGSGWTEAASLVTSDGQDTAGYGESVAISGDTIVIGEPGFDFGTGKAYVFVRPTGGWAGTILESAQLLNVGGGHLDLMGTSVSISGDTIVVGRPNPPFAGSVLVFTRPRAGWSGPLGPSAVLTAAASYKLGISVAISGDVAVSGDAGEAFLWIKPSSGWNGVIGPSAELQPSIPGPEYPAVAIDGDTVVVTAPGLLYQNGDNQTTGVSFLFEKPSSGWGGTLSETARLVPDAGEANWATADFGLLGVSISNDIVVIGSPDARR